MSDPDRPREESPWYCSECRAWVGWKLDTCFECERDRPRFPLRYDDVPFDDSQKVQLRHRIKARLTGVRRFYIAK